MKNLKYLLCVALVSCFIMACNQDPVKRAVGILEKATEKIEKCNSYDEVLKITEEASKELEKNQVDEDKLTPEQKKALAEAVANYLQACMKKMPMDKMVDFPSLGDGLDEATDESYDENLEKALDEAIDLPEEE